MLFHSVRESSFSLCPYLYIYIIMVFESRHSRCVLMALLLKSMLIHLLHSARDTISVPSEDSPQPTCNAARPAPADTDSIHSLSTYNDSTCR